MDAVRMVIMARQALGHSSGIAGMQNVKGLQSLRS